MVIELSFKTPMSPFQLAMLREGEAKENKRLIEEYEEGLIYEITPKGLKALVTKPKG